MQYFLSEVKPILDGNKTTPRGGGTIFIHAAAPL
jgi:hypothetical protein